MPPRPSAGPTLGVGIFLLAMAGAPGALLGAADLSWDRPAGVQELVTEGARFGRFAAQVAADVDQALAAPTAPAAETLGRLLALRVHLGLFLGHDARALSAATQIRESVTPAPERPFSGLLTEALVIARAQSGGGPAGPGFAAALRPALADRLATLPATAELTGVLERQRDRFRALTREALLAEGAELGARLDRAPRWTLADVDAVVRLGHRLATILPVRDVLLAAFDDALAQRPRAGAGPTPGSTASPPSRRPSTPPAR